MREWVDRLLSDGVDVILDIYDLQEGQDKNAFMERMVTDPNVTHVLVICDKGYAEKADARKQGVGTESQIISQEVYDQVEQTKFIPNLYRLSVNLRTMARHIFLHFYSRGFGLTSLLLKQLTAIGNS